MQSPSTPEQTVQDLLPSGRSRPRLLQEAVPLAPFTTFGIGGPARWFAEAATEDDLLSACSWARASAISVFVLGGGSNVLVADAGYPGLVLRVALRGIEQVSAGSEPVFRVAAGESWEAFVDRSLEENVAGIECLAGIPGTVGGTPVQNVGAYGQEVADTIRLVRCLDRETLRFVTFSAAECGFAYRSSRFNHGPDQNRYIVISVDFALRPDGAPHLEYADLRKHFAARGAAPTLAETAEAVRAIRARKGMVIPEGAPGHRDPDTRSAGSFFKNPAVPTALYEQLAKEYPGMPGYPAAASAAGVPQRKLSAAWLLEHAGFAKGFSVGPAALSSKHTLALTNHTGTASAADILALRDCLVAGVRDRFGVVLEPEPVYVGERAAAPSIAAAAAPAPDEQAVRTIQQS